MCRVAYAEWDGTTLRDIDRLTAGLACATGLTLVALLTLLTGVPLTRVLGIAALAGVAVYVLSAMVTVAIVLARDRRRARDNAARWRRIMAAADAGRHERPAYRVVR